MSRHVSDTAGRRKKGSKGKKKSVKINQWIIPWAGTRKRSEKESWKIESSNCQG